MSVVLELPGVWIDQVVLDDLSLAAGADFLRVFNRTPEPDQIQIRTDTLISLDLGVASGDSVVVAQTQVFVSVDDGPEVLTYDGNAGGFQSGWDGPASATSTPDANSLRIAIDPVADFSSLQTVTVRVLSASANALALDESWSFTIEDLSLPVLVNAQATSKTTISVLFDEPVNQASAVVAANYTITGLTVPSVDVVVQSVAIDTTNSVILTLDIEMTPAASYQLAVENVADLFGNVIGPPFNTRTFLGFLPQIPDGRDFNLYRMVPRKNRDEDAGDLLKFLTVLQEPTDLLLCSIDEWSQILDPDIAPEAFVDAMLCDLGNPFDFDLTLIDKRRLLRVLVPIYKQKGTDPGIVNAIRFFLGIEVTVNAFNEEGWILGEDELGDSVTEGTAILGPGTSFARFSFDIESPVVLTETQRARIRSIANYMKPGHTHLINIVEPVIPEILDPVELGLSELGVDWILH